MLGGSEDEVNAKCGKQRLIFQQRKQMHRVIRRAHSPRFPIVINEVCTERLKLKVWGTTWWLWHIDSSQFDTLCSPEHGLRLEGVHDVQKLRHPLSNLCGLRVSTAIIKLATQIAD